MAASTPPATEPATTEPAASDARPWLVPGPVALGIAGVALLAAYWFAFEDFFLLQYHFATEEAADWGHTLFVPLIALYVVFIHRADLVAQPFRPGWTGIGLVVAGLAWYGLTWIAPDSTFLNSHNVRSIGVFLALAGVCVATLGWRSIVWLWFPLLYLLVFGQRITDKVLLQVTYPLQDVASWGSWHLLDLLGYTLLPRTGNAIEIMRTDGTVYPLDVAEACSGMRMLMAFLALGTVIAYVGLDRWWLRIVLVLTGVPIAVVVNILRICTLGILGLHGEEFMFGEFHALVGLVWMIPTFALFLLVMWFLQPFEEDESGNRKGRGAGSAEPRETRPARFPRSVVPAAVAAGFALVFGGAAVSATIDALGLHIVKAPVAPRAPLATIPSRLGPWRQVGEDTIFRDTLVEVLGTERYLQRTYTLEDAGETAATLSLHLAYYTDLAGTAPHVPERCWSVHGGVGIRRPESIVLDLPALGRETALIHRGAERPYRVVDLEDPILGGTKEHPLPVGPVGLRSTMFGDSEDPRLRQLGGYFFVANGRTTDSALAVENVAFDLTSSHAYYCKIQLDMIAESTGDDEALMGRYRDLCADFIAHLLPELARVLPDWRTYERRREDVDREG